jgi:hypothetical protein
LSVAHVIQLFQISFFVIARLRSSKSIWSQDIWLRYIFEARYCRISPTLGLSWNWLTGPVWTNTCCMIFLLRW